MNSNNPKLILNGDLEVTVEMIREYDNDESVAIKITDFNTDTEVEALLNFAELDALIGFLRGSN